ncbi:hypothetical protein ACFE04_009287 [Oxalis oulophora]
MNNAWSDIPEDILCSIYARLPIMEVIVSNSVCKSWQSMVGARLDGIQFPSQVPWLMLAEENNKHGLSSSSTGLRSFVDLSSKNIFELYVPETTNRKCFGVGFGWLLTIDIHLQMDLFHPLTRRKINLPHYSTFEKYNPQYDNEIKEPTNIHFQKAIVTADPWDPKVQDFNQDCIIMVIYAYGSPAFAKLGDKTWTDVQLDYPHQYDVVYYKSQFYFINGYDVLAYKMDGDQPPSTNHIVRIPTHSHNYLVESEGELLLIFRSFENNRPTEVPHLTTSFEVLRLIKIGKHGYELEEVKTLGNRSLFLGYSASFSLSATDLNGYRGDCIYFTDDLLNRFFGKDDCGGRDMGIYNLRNKTFEQLYARESLSFFFPPLWYI